MLKIPERLEEYDSGLFVVLNLKNENFEIHSLDNIGNSYSFTVPYSTLDARILHKVEQNDLKKKSLKAIVQEMDRKNDELERRNERRRRDDIRGIASEIKPMFKKLAEEVY